MHAVFSQDFLKWTCTGGGCVCVCVCNEMWPDKPISIRAEAIALSEHNQHAQHKTAFVIYNSSVPRLYFHTLMLLTRERVSQTTTVRGVAGTILGNLKG